jgi:hypothetical protein
LFETREYQGWWWLPNEEGDELPGVLRIERAAATLELFGHFGLEVLSQTPTEIVSSGSLAEQPLILGRTSDGKRITLEGHVSAGYVMNTSGFTTSTYRRLVVVVGAHFDRSESISFDEIAIDASDLGAWSQVKTVQTTARFRKRGRYRTWSRASTMWRDRDDLEIPLARGEQARISFGARFEGFDVLGRPGDHAAIRQSTELRLRFRKPARLDDVFARVGQIRNFLTLAVGRPVSVISVTGYRDAYGDDGRLVPIELLWAIPHNPDPPAKRRDAHEMLFTLPEAAPDIGKVIRSWFAKQERLQPVFNLFFGMRYHPDMYLDVRFLMNAQAVETYAHRRGRKPVERSFADQIREVLANSQRVSRKIVGDDADAFIAHLKVSRNYYTHYNPKYESKAARGAALFLLTLQLQALIEMSLLRELGFGHKAIDAILDRVGRYREIRHFAAYAADEGTD